MDSSPLISHSSIEEISTNNDTNNKSKIASYLSDGLLVVGNSMVVSGNGLINKIGLLPFAPALCFIIDGAINSSISLFNLMLSYRNNNNKIVNNLSTVVSSLATTVSLSTAISLINWTSAAMPVKDAFIAAATASGFNTLIVGVETIKDAYTDEENTTNQQPTLWQKMTNTATSLLPLITVTSAITGVSIFAYNKLSNANDDDNKSFFDKESTAFYLTIAGLVANGFGLSIKTVNKWKNWCANRTYEFDLDNVPNNISYNTASSSTSSSSLTSSDDQCRFSVDNINAKQSLLATSLVDNSFKKYDDSNPFNNEEIKKELHSQQSPRLRRQSI